MRENTPIIILIVVMIITFASRERKGNKADAQQSTNKKSNSEKWRWKSLKNVLSRKVIRNSTLNHFFSGTILLLSYLCLLQKERKRKNAGNNESKEQPFKNGQILMIDRWLLCFIWTCNKSNEKLAGKLTFAANSISTVSMIHKSLTNVITCFKKKIKKYRESSNFNYS